MHKIPGEGLDLLNFFHSHGLAMYKHYGGLHMYTLDLRMMIDFVALLSNLHHME